MDRVDAVVDLASSVVKKACQVWAGPLAPATETLTDMVRAHIDDRLGQRRIERFFDECIDTVADKLVKLLAANSSRIPEHELTAAVDAVRSTFDAAELSDMAVVANDLDARLTERTLAPSSRAVLATAALSSQAESFYHLVLRESCAYLVEMVTTLPKFHANAFTELLRRSSAILETLEQVIERLPARRGVDDFDADYRRLVAHKYDRLTLFGVAASREAARRYPLSVAYISLGAVTHGSYDAEIDAESAMRGLRIAEATLGPTALDWVLSVQDTPRYSRVEYWQAHAEWLAAKQGGSTASPMLFVSHSDWEDKGRASYLLELWGTIRSRSTRRSSSPVVWVDNTEIRPSPVAGETRVEDVLADARRTMLVGEAGSGKTTLLHWLAVRSARRDFAGTMDSWNECVPFFIPLRRYADTALPTPTEFPNVVSTHIAGEMPEGWVHELLRSGRALILIDGIDELQDGAPRKAAREWLDDLVTSFPWARYVVTSRPAAVGEEWRGWNGFTTAELQPMPPVKIRMFVQQWHDAMRSELSTREDRLQLDGDQAALLTLIESDRHLRALCVNPLLCALLCALNRERRRQLPRNRMGVYRAALEMLLDLRDRERGVSSGGLTYDQKIVLLQDFALFLVRNAWSDAPVSRVEEQLARSLRTLHHVSDTPNEILRSLLERSGLLRQPTVDRIDFVHRSFQEYLAGKAAVENDEIGFLTTHADDDQLRDVIIMAVGHAQPRQRAELLRNLIVRAKAGSSKGASANRMRLLVTACLQTAPQLDPDLRGQIEEMAAALLPPESVEIAPELAAAGDVVLDLLAERPPQTVEQARASVRVATLIGGTDAMATIAEIASRHEGLDDELARAWSSFDPETYAREVMSKLQSATTDDAGRSLTITDLTLLPLLHHLSWLQSLTVNSRSLSTLRDLPRQPATLLHLCLVGHSLRDLDGIESWSGLTHLDVELRYAGTRLNPLTALTRLSSLRIRCADNGVIDLGPLTKLKHLAVLQLGQPNAKFIKLQPVASLTDLTIYIPPGVTVLGRDSVGARSTVIRGDEFPPL